MYGVVLDRLYSQCVKEQTTFLSNSTGYDRALTGDGATILVTKFINFLCHEFGKDVMFLRIKDYTTRFQEVGSIQATFIAHEMMNAIRFCMHVTVCVYA